VTSLGLYPWLASWLGLGVLVLWRHMTVFVGLLELRVASHELWGGSSDRKGNCQDI